MTVPVESRRVTGPGSDQPSDDAPSDHHSSRHSSGSGARNASLFSVALNRRRSFEKEQPSIPGARRIYGLNSRPLGKVLWFDYHAPVPSNTD